MKTLAAIQYAGQDNQMNRVEIKLNKGGHLTMISFFIAASVIAIWGVTSTDAELWVKLSLTIFLPFWFYYTYKIIVKINEPVIILTRTAIQILDKNMYRSFSWADIVDYKIEENVTNHHVDYSLVISTKTGTSIFKINGIAKKPDELRQLISEVRA